MKTKLLSILLVAVMILTLIPSAFAAKTNPEPLTTASYATVLPIIDGVIDDIWETTEAQETKNNYTEGSKQAYGYTKILWTETTLYFLAVVTDPTVATSRWSSIANGANFWVSETNSDAEWYEAPGDWHIFANQDGNFNYYTGNKAAQEKGICKTAIHADAEVPYYVVELEMPLLTEGLVLAEGMHIGYDVSIDDDDNADNKRDEYASWSGIGAYWDDPFALATVLLVKPAAQ